MRFKLDWSWFGILRSILVLAAIATGGPTLVRDFMALNSATPAEAARYWAWFRICAVLSLIVLWVQEHWRVTRLERRLSPRLRLLPIVYDQPWTDTRGNCVSYYLDVVNESDGSTVEGVEVKLTALDPPVIRWLPVPLHIKHDNTVPYQREFSLNPLDKKQIDLVSSVQGSQNISIVHTIGQGPLVSVPSGKYRMTVTATGKDVRPSTHVFEIWVDGTGYLQCRAI